MRKRLLWTGVGSAVLLTVIAIVLTLSGAFSGSRPDAARATGGLGSVETATIGGTSPGSLVSAATMPGLRRTAAGRAMESARVTYRSTSGDSGESTVVSGAVFVPKGTAPPGGWPVVAYGHGTTGIDEPCALSLSDSLLGQISAVEEFTGRGYAVALTDYQGLGSDGIHPYLDSRTAGFNVIDSVRALRATFKDVSTRWVAYGGSQGGGAVWSADEQASGYAPELDLLGAVALSPVTDMIGIVDKAQAGTLTTEQGTLVVAIVESLARLHPDLNRDDYRHGAAAQSWDALAACSGKLLNDRDAAIGALTPNDFAPSTPEAAQRLRDLLAQWALPQKPLSAPLTVEYGGADTYLDAAWTAAAIQRACQLGGTVVPVFDPAKGHSQGDDTYEFGWIADRFNGTPVVNGC